VGYCSISFGGKIWSGEEKKTGKCERKKKKEET
jgi:hypothetical protein